MTFGDYTILITCIVCATYLGRCFLKYRVAQK